MKNPEYGWFVEHADTDSAFLLLVRDYKTFIARVKKRAHEVGHNGDLTELVNHCTYRAIYEQDRFGSMSSVLAAVTPPAKELLSIGRVLDGTLRITNRTITDESGPFLALGISAFWAPHAAMWNPAKLDRLAEFAIPAHMTYVRWFGAHDWAGGVNPHAVPAYWHQMETTIIELAERGLRSEITFFTRRHMIPDPEGYVKRWAEIVERHRDKVILSEICNEYNHPHNGFDMGEVQHLSRIFNNNCGGPLACSSPIAGDSFEGLKDMLYTLNGGSRADVTSVHYPRRDNTGEGAWRAVRQAWHTRGRMPGCPDFTVDNEHARWDKVAGGKKTEVAVSLCLVPFIAGCGMSTHHDVFGVHEGRGEYGADLPSVGLQQVFAKVLPLLPPDLPNWQSTRVPFHDHPFPELIDQHWSFGGGSSGVSRAYAAVQNEKFVMLLTGVRGQVKLTTQKDRDYTAISLKNARTVYSGRGHNVILPQSEGEAYLVLST